MEDIINKYISSLYRPGLISYGLNNALAKARDWMAFFNLSQEDLEAAGIIVDDPAGRAGRDAILPGTPENYRSAREID